MTGTSKQISLGRQVFSAHVSPHFASPSSNTTHSCIITVEFCSVAKGGRRVCEQRRFATSVSNQIQAIAQIYGCIQKGHEKGLAVRFLPAPLPIHSLTWGEWQNMRRHLCVATLNTTIEMRERGWCRPIIKCIMRHTAIRSEFEKPVTLTTNSDLSYINWWLWWGTPYLVYISCYLPTILVLVSCDRHVRLNINVQTFLASQ